MTTVGNLNENEVDYNTITSTRPTDATFYRRVQIDIKPTATPNQYSVTVRWKKTPTGNFIDLMTFNTDPASPPPAQMKVGFAASTGNARNNHEIRNVLVTTPGNIRISSRANVDVLRTVAGSNTISYTLDVVNDNPVPLTNVLFRDSLTDANGNMVPLSAFTITNVTTNGFNAGTTAGSSSTENKITGSLNIAANTTAKITITGTLNSVPDGNQLNNNASITPTDISDPDLDNNVTTASTPVLAEDIDVTLTKTVTDPCLNTSGNTFEIIVQNVGTLPTVTTNNNRILLRDTFPSTYNIAFAANAGWNSPNLTNLPNGTRAFAVTYTQPLNSSASTPPFRYTLTAPAGTPSYTDRAWVFYVNVSDQNIELTANRNNNSDADFIQVRSAAPTAVTSRAYCLGEAATALTATPSAGNTLLWYSTPTSVSSVNAPTPATSVAGTINYYVSQTNGSCESPLTTIAVTTQSAVSPGTIGTAQTICRAGTPAALTSITAGAGGSGTASYSRQSSTDGSNWTNISGATAVTYSPPALTQSTYFRRVYTSTLSGKACSANTPPYSLPFRVIPRRV
ncbi:hypothetical protein MKQ70_13565 [Chitinophaga sedimenti]|uniref:Ig-like domain-containing protein n=1 Tax=Chitinophaga sedimenti TaxID=2033606 RepID=UPI00200591C2|nr:hypothetical protein [Chitinophaga sedimenti]MCK7555994.1 hypothetical protein [Chitinophaga sedimenti]